MRHILAAAVLACFGALPVQAATCLFVVNGLTVIDGPCDYEPIDDDGSFKVFSPDRGYFAYLLIERRGVAQGYWNEDRWSNHAHTPLGTLLRDDACWSNGYATVCAW